MQLKLLSTVDAASPFFGQTPTVVPGDEWVLAGLTTPDSYALLPLSDGTASYAGGATRQSWLNAIYDRSMRDWYATDEVGDTFTIVVNDQSPTQTASIPTQQWYTHIPITPVILGDYVSDPDDAESLLAYSGLSVSGLSIVSHVYNPGQVNERTVWQIQGTPGAAGSGSISLIATDPYGATLNLSAFSYDTDEAILVPQVSTGTTTLAIGLAAFDSAGLNLVGIIPELSGVAVGNIFSQIPPALTYVIPGTAAVLYVSGVARPVVIGLTQAAAIAALEAAGFIVSVEAQYTEDDESFGLVIAQSPSSGVALAGETVLITVSLGVLDVLAEVRAHKPGFFDGLYRVPGDTFNLTEPEQYSPYWMEFINGVPASWAGRIAVFNPYVDREILEF